MVFPRVSFRNSGGSGGSSSTSGSGGFKLRSIGSKKKVRSSNSTISDGDEASINNNHGIIINGSGNCIPEQAPPQRPPVPPSVTTATSFTKEDTIKHIDNNSEDDVDEDENSPTSTTSSLVEPISQHPTPSPSPSEEGAMSSPLSSSSYQRKSLGRGHFTPLAEEDDVVVDYFDTATNTTNGPDANGDVNAMVSSDVFDASNVRWDGEIAGKLSTTSHDGYFSAEENIHHLNSGGVIFSFTCHHNLQQYERQLIHEIANLSGFPDETRDNYVPHISCDTSHELDVVTNEFTPVLVKAAYILPGVSNLKKQICNPQLLASTEYQSANQPHGTKIWNKSECAWLDDTTFRMTRAIVPYVYSITIQFKVSEITDPTTLQALSRLVGVQVDGALLLERTKRSVPPKQDRTRKAKSVLLYTKTPGDGVLVNHITVILQSSLPWVVENVIDTFGTMGLSEACETTRKTRQYIRNHTSSSSPNTTSDKNHT